MTKKGRYKGAYLVCPPLLYALLLVGANVLPWKEGQPLLIVLCRKARTRRANSLSCRKAGTRRGKPPLLHRVERNNDVGGVKLGANSPLSLVSDRSGCRTVARCDTFWVAWRVVIGVVDKTTFCRLKREVEGSCWAKKGWQAGENTPLSRSIICVSR